MNEIKLLEEIRDDFVSKFDNDPQIKRVCNVMINEFKARKKALNLPEVSRSAKVRICEPFEVEETGEKYKVEINHFVDKNGLWEKETVIVKVD